MADISAEIAAFQNAVYGEEVRSSMVSAIEKINDVCEDAESTVENFSSGVTQAISADCRQQRGYRCEQRGECSDRQEHQHHERGERTSHG